MGRRAKPPSGGSEAELSVMLESGAAAERLRETGMVTRVGTKKHTKSNEFGARNLLHVVNRDPDVAGSLAHWRQMQNHARVMAHHERQIAHFTSLGEKYKAEHERATRDIWLLRIGRVATYAGLGALALYSVANRAKFGRPAHLYTD